MCERFAASRRWVRLSANTLVRSGRDVEPVRGRRFEAVLDTTAAETKPSRKGDEWMEQSIARLALGRRRNGRRRRVARRPVRRAQASSHREAPLISEDPTADDTDMYVFRSPDKPDTVTIISQLDPGRGPGRRPELVHVLADRAVRHLRRPQRRREAGHHVLLPVQDRDAGRVPRQHAADLHGDEGRRGKSTVVGNGLMTPPDNIGPRSTPELPRARREGRAHARRRQHRLRRPA